MKSKLFKTVDTQYTQYNGLDYTIIRKLNQTEVDDEVGNMYEIKLSNDVIIMARDRALTPKQKAFCEAYAKSGNGMRAAIEAGYSEMSASKALKTILDSPAVIEYLKELNKEMETRRTWMKLLLLTLMKLK